jgi:hypothetical protein
VAGLLQPSSSALGGRGDPKSALGFTTFMMGRLGNGTADVSLPLLLQEVDSSFSNGCGDSTTSSALGMSLLLFLLSTWLPNASSYLPLKLLAALVLVLPVLASSSSILLRTVVTNAINNSYKITPKCKSEYVRYLLVQYRTSQTLLQCTIA